MKKTEKLNNLFITWQKDVLEYKKHFISDGIINEELYNKQKNKILFITKEANDPDKKENWDFREWWNEKIHYAFSYRISEWSFGLLNHFKIFNGISYKEKLESIQSIAFMNIKKNGGKGKSEYKDIENHLIANKELINKQIDIIDPDLIILGLTWKELRNQLIENVEWKNCGYNIDVCKWKGRKVIDFYHPSSRNAPAASYSLMENVVNSIIFRDL